MYLFDIRTPLQSFDSIMENGWAFSKRSISSPTFERHHSSNGQSLMCDEDDQVELTTSRHGTRAHGNASHIYCDGNSAVTPCW